MTTTSGLVLDLDVPRPPAPSGPAADGFVDCRGQWHSWADEERD